MSRGWRAPGPWMVCLALFAASLLAGCAAVGPPRVERDRIEYNASITESWKRQILLNIVKIRYVEPVFFMDVGEIVAGYTLETGGSVSGSRSWFDLSADSDATTLGLDAYGKYTDRPTVTYRPMTGHAFLKGVMSPLPVGNLLMAMQAGVSATFLCKLGVRAINGRRNEVFTAEEYRPASREFLRAADILGRLQAAGALHVTSRKPEGGGPPPVYLTLAPHTPQEDALAAELRDVLGLDPGTDDYRVCNSSLPGEGDTLSLQTNSLMVMLAAVAQRVEVPEDDLRRGRATPGSRPTGMADVSEMVRVRSSAAEPQDPFVAVRYRDNWFWVDDADLPTKRVFTFIMLAFTLLESGRGDNPLQVTIPAQ